ncbi:MAG TPA: tol-pal system protein YbgF [Gemmatimonadaceae bacterium]|nr:tol-pal system protein YbgF [Gemmatimonadaceae bacterium]
MPLAVLAAACATPADVRLVRDDLRAIRAERSRADSAQAAQIARIAASLDTVGDTLRAVTQRLTRLQGDVRGELYALGQQLIQIQELTGQSQRRLQEMRSSLEQRNQEVAVPVAPGETPAAGASAGPGPNQLFQLSLDQLRRGSAGTARAGFQELLRTHPTSDVAPDAQFYLGEALAAEGNTAAADTAYAQVVSKWPESPRAPTALYKRALALEARANLTAARAALNLLVQRYPRSDEAALARDRLRTMRQ